MTQHLIKVFGERNTGTRAILQMIRALPELTTSHPELRKSEATKTFERRIEDRFHGRWRKEYLDGLTFDTRQEIGGVVSWKHTAPVFDSSFSKANCRVIFLVKNPYSWLISFAKRPYHTKGRKFISLEQFIDSPWLTLPVDGIASVLDSPVQLWSQKLLAYKNFIETCDIPVTIVYFESFVQNPVDTLGAALVDFGLDPSGLKAIPHSTKDRNQSSQELQDFYGLEKWRHRLTRQSVALINQYTDTSIANYFGFKRLDPRDFPLQLPKDIQRAMADELSRKKILPK